ncbi:hypothetical protein BKG96_09695 [Rodentibacter caecimuris]|uniref:Uncharacterized protein n=2 Tax=Rodentibacter caecimuris TaxID=1796644 RepID=A0A1V3KGT7_9PAST|nr:hypothetical protein [Rodentibacter heylii]OOF76826.1 hypothetical protein BKG96_09695 [Rodentibacter heylii]
MADYSKKYIARHVKFISPDMIEVKRPISPMIRFFIFMFYVVFMIIAFVEYQSKDNISNQDVWDAFFHPKELKERKYQEYVIYVTEDIEGKTRKENEIKLFQPDYHHNVSASLTSEEIEKVYYTSAKLKEYLNKECNNFQEYICAEFTYFRLYNRLAEIKTPTFEEFENGHANIIINLRQWGYTLFLTPFFLLLFFSLIPNQRPVRIDKHKKIAYLQSWGRFYIYKIPKIIFQRKKYCYSADIVNQMYSFNNTLFLSTTTSKEDISDLGNYLLPMIYNEKPRVILLGLPGEKKESIIVRQIGDFGIGEGELMDFIEEFLLSDNDDFYSMYSNDNRKNCFHNMLSFTLFPIRYNEDKTLERIEKWLNRPSNNEESQNLAKARAIYYQIEKKVDKVLIRKIIILAILASIASLLQTLRLRGLL